VIYNTSQHRGTFIFKFEAVKEEQSTQAKGWQFIGVVVTSVAGEVGILVGGVQVCSCKENPYTQSHVAFAIISN